MTILIFSVLALFSVLFPSSRKVAFLLLLFSWLLFGWNFDNGDYKSYENTYNNEYALINYESGFQALVYLSKSAGFGYQNFLIASSALVLLLWGRVIYKLSNFPAIFCSIFIVFFLPLDFVLLRNFLAFGIVSQGLLALFLDTKWKQQKFIICVFLATMVHSSSIFYLILIALFYYKNFNFIKISIGVGLGLVFYFMIGKDFLYGFLNDSGNRSIIYQSNLITFFGLIIYQLICTYLVFLLTKIKMEEEIFDKIQLLLNINFVMLFMIILYYDFSIFIRLYRNIALINTIFIINVLYGCKFNPFFKISLICFFIIFLVYMYISFIFPFQDTTIKALFFNNLIFN